MGNSNKRRELRASRESSGVCIYCGINPPKDGSKGCNICLEKKYAAHKRYLASHPEKQIEYRRRIRAEVIRKYGGKCSCCNESVTEFLVIDHVNRDGNTERRELYGSQTGASFRWFLKLKRESTRDDLRVLCYNCNNAIHIYGTCPHEHQKETDQKCVSEGCIRA